MAENQDITTTLRIQAQLEGSDQAQQRARDLEDALMPERAIQAFEKLEQNLESLGRGLAFLGQQGAQQLEVLERGFDRIADKAKKTGEEIQRAGRFTQGFAQGVGLGEYLPSGPGMGRQIAGRVSGTVLRGLASSPFTGLAGLGTALSAIPGGGTAAGLLQQGVGFAERALAFETMELNALPLLDIAGGFGAMQNARPSPDAQARIAQLEAERARLQALATGAAVPGVAGGMNIPLTTTGGTTQGQAGPGGMAATQLADIEQQIKDARESAQRNAQTTAFREAALSPVSVLREYGGRFGYTEDAALQLGSAAGDVAGGMGVLGRQKLLGFGLATNRLFGIGPETVGRFAAGANLGGLASGREGQDALEQAIVRGLRLGLEGSDLRNYVADIAAGVDEFKRTGLRVHDEAMGGVAEKLAGFGLGGVRAGVAAQAFDAAAGRVATQGPRDYFDLLMLRGAGFTGRGGLAEYQRARAELEGGGLTDRSLLGMMGAVSAGRTGEMGMFNIGELLRRLGLGSVIEQRRIAATFLGQQELLTPNEQALAQAAGFRADEGLERGEATMAAIQRAGGIPALAQAASRGAAPGVMRSVALEAEQRAVGRTMMPVMQDLAESTTASARALSNFAPSIQAITSALTNAAKAIEDATDGINARAKKRPAH